MVKSLKTVGLAVAFLAAMTALVAASGPPIVPKAERKFDHDKHAQILAGEKTTADCATCHKADTAGKAMGRDHARCDGGKCHNLDHDMQSCQLVKVPGPKSPARQCQICHVSTRKECIPNDLPPLTTKVSFVPTFAHDKHMKMGGVGQQQCASCHKAEAGEPPPDVHAGCAGDPKSPNKKGGCHADSQNPVSMTKCSGCHVDLGKAPKAPANDAYSVAKTFDHGHHNLKRNMTNCSLCHAQLATAANGAFPKPPMAGCATAGCHDGKGAFAAFGTSCTKCHAGSNEPAIKSLATVGFSHAVHEKRNVKVGDCTQCHVLAPDGMLAPPGENKNHMPCAESGCHQTEFASRQTKICGSCHAETAPWIKAVSRLPVRDFVAGTSPVPQEWWQTTNHAVHVKKLGATNATCEGCHGTAIKTASEGGSTAAAQRNHKACAPCHNKNQPPAMTDCLMCHKNKAVERAGISAWTVAVNFKHDMHAVDPHTKQATPCLQCHVSVATATDLVGIAAPPMKQCESCHDGKAAFKTTGFECARCHTKAAPAAAPSALVRPFLQPPSVQLGMVETRR